MTKQNKDKLTDAVNMSIDYLVKTHKALSPEEKKVYLTQARRVVEEGIMITNNELIKMQKRNIKLKK